MTTALLVALGLALRILGPRGLVGPKRRHVNQHFRLGGARRLGDRVGAKGVDGIEALRPGGIENSGQIDHGVRPFAGRSKRGGITHIGLNWHDLAGSFSRASL